MLEGTTKVVPFPNRVESSVLAASPATTSYFLASAVQFVTRTSGVGMLSG